MRVKKALEKYLGSIYPAAEVEIFDFCFCGRANIAVRVQMWRRHHEHSYSRVLNLPVSHMLPWYRVF